MSAKPKKRGRPATGRHPMVGVRASPEMRRQIEKWAADQSDAPSLSEAIRRLVEMGLTVKPAARRKSTADRAAGAALAEEHASGAIGRRQRGLSQTEGERVSRKHRLLKGPQEFEQPEKPNRTAKAIPIEKLNSSNDT